MNLECFLLDTEEGLQRWYNIHNDPQAWADNWVLGEPDNAAHWLSESHTIENNFFSFDWWTASIRRLADDWLPYFYRCPECDYISEDVCPNGCDAEQQPIEDVDVLIDWMGGDWSIPDYIAMEALEQDGYPIYREALAHIVDDISEDVAEALERIRAVADGADKLTAIMAALSIMHHSGCIAQDDGDWQLVEDVRADGFADTFGAEEVRDYIADSL